jgi:hypothetical protein
MTAPARAETADWLIGVCDLVSWYETKPNGDIEYPLGEDAVGAQRRPQVNRPGFSRSAGPAQPC